MEKGLVGDKTNPSVSVTHINIPNYERTIYSVYLIFKVMLILGSNIRVSRVIIL